MPAGGEQPWMSWNQAYALAASVLTVWVVLVALLALRDAGWRPGRALVDEDGRWSPTKTGAALWTLAVGFALLAILFRTQGAGLEDDVLKEEYLVVLGIPLGARTATMLVEGRAAERSRIKENESPTGLLDYQYLSFSVLLLAFFLVGFLADPGEGLPDLPDTLVGVTGVSALAYLGKEGADAVRPP